MTPVNQPLKSLAVDSDSIKDWQLLPEHPNWASQCSAYWQPGEAGAAQRLDRFIANQLKGYKTNRNIPILDATSKLSPYLHFGEISPWSVWRAVQ